MKDPKELLEYENIEIKNGVKLIAGVDEVGRGPLAGPVVCASCIMPLDDLIEGVNDSKKLTEKTRERLFDIIKEKAICYNIFEVDEKTIDEINILNATKLCMKSAVEGLKFTPETLLVDAVKLEDLNPKIKQVSIIKGDAKSYNIACASILAKVYRDRLMVRLDEVYPQYNFKKNKGYGTAEHIKALKEFGATPIHRRSFIKNFNLEEK